MELRRIEKLNEENWEIVRMQDLKIGDVFRMFDDLPEDGKEQMRGENNFIVREEPKLVDNEISPNEKVWGVKVDKIKKRRHQ